MTSSLGFTTQNSSPRANVFLLVNLGCEMLYVVDQRLKSQKISDEKSFQVVHDITTVLLEPKFIDSIIMGSKHVNSQLITPEHCKFMLKDAATCSLMRLDESSMDKLWSLMTMLFKWQLFVSRHPHHLIDITFRHLNEIAKIQPDAKRTALIEYTKDKLLDFWNTWDENEQLAIYQTNITWLECFNTKISVLIRLGFQRLDGNFVRENNVSYFQEFIDTIGDNIYEKSAQVAANECAALKENQELLQLNTAKYDVNRLDEMLNCQNNGSDAEDLKPIDAKNFQKLFVKNLQQCNILFEDLDVNGSETTQSPPVGCLSENMRPFLDAEELNPRGDFVQRETVYKRGNITNAGANTHGMTAFFNKDLLELYSKMK